jgi:hypothetical protein
MNNWLKTIKNFGKKPAPKPRSSGTSRPKSNTKKGGSHKKGSGKKGK